MRASARACGTLAVSLVSLGLPAQEGVGPLLDRYRAAGAGSFVAQAGAAAWSREVSPGGGQPGRSCASCHGTDLRRPGKHVRTGKLIDPLAPSVRPQRLSDEKQVEKWLLRNCKWTWGRECTVQEKGDFVVFIQSR